MKQITLSLKGAVALEKAIDTVKKEMSRGSYKTLLFHIYSGVEDESVIRAVTGRLSMSFPDCHFVGTLSAGEIVDKHIPEKGIAVSAMFFETTDIKVLRGVDVKGNEKVVGMKLAEEANAIPELKALELLMPGTEFNTHILLDELAAVSPDVIIYGGYSGGHQLEKSEHYIFDENGIDDNAIYAIAYYGKDFHVQVDKSAGWQRLGMPFKVTKAEDNRLIEINNAPAVEVYEKYLQINRNDNFAEETFEFPLMASMDGEELLRHTITVEDNGTLVLAGYVLEGMDIYLSYGNPEDIIRKVDHRLEEVEMFNPQAILIFSCSVRKAFWENFAEIEIEPFAEIAETSGFYTWGEVKRNPDNGRLYEYNITMLTVAMREGDAEPLENRYRVDDTVLKGQVSLPSVLQNLPVHGECLPGPGPVRLLIRLINDMTRLIRCQKGLVVIQCVLCEDPGPISCVIPQFSVVAAVRTDHQHPVRRKANTNAGFHFCWSSGERSARPIQVADARTFPSASVRHTSSALRASQRSRSVLLSGTSMPAMSRYQIAIRAILSCIRSKIIRSSAVLVRA